MNDERISQLRAAMLPLTGAEKAAIVQNGETRGIPVSALAALAEAYAQIAAGLIGPIYGSASEGLAATQDGDEFAVDALNGTATIYLNDNGTAVAIRAVILNPTAPAAAGLIGTLDGTLQEVLTDILARLDALES